MPDRSVGRVTLGMARADVWKHLGKPTDIHFLHHAGRSYTVDSWQSEDSSRCRTVILRWNEVVQIERFVTADECRNGLFGSIRRQHPRTEEKLYYTQEEVGAILFVDDVRHGIAWTLPVFHEDSFRMSLFNEIGPRSMIIHRPGHFALPPLGEQIKENDLLITDIRTWFAASPPR